MAILMIGGTGAIGSRVVQKLTEAGADVRVLARDAARATLPAGAAAVPGDLTQPDSVRAALAGIDTVFLLNAVVPDELVQALTVVGLVRDAGIKGLVYFSVLNGELFTDVPHFAGKRTVERMIEADDLPATVLRPGTFMQNDARLKDAVMAGVYPQPLGDIGVAMVDADDIATIAAQALLAREKSPTPLPRETIEIAGPEDLTGASVAAIWQDVLGREVTYGGDDLDAFEGRLKAFAPPWMAFDMRAMNRGFQTHGMRPSPATRADLERRLGRPLRSYRDFAVATAAAWRSK